MKQVEGDLVRHCSSGGWEDETHPVGWPELFWWQVRAEEAGELGGDLGLSGAPALQSSSLQRKWGCDGGAG